MNKKSDTGSAPELVDDIDADILSWLGNIETSEHVKVLAKKPLFTESGISILPKKLFFFIKRHFNRSLEIQLKLIALKKDGTPGKSQPQKFNYFQFLRDPHNTNRQHLCEKDWDLLLDATRSGTLNESSIYLMHSKDPAAVLKSYIETKRSYIGAIGRGPVQWGNKRKGAFSWKVDEKCMHQKLVHEIESPSESTAETIQLGEKIYYIDPATNEIGEVIFAEPPEVVSNLLSAPPIPLEQTNKVSKYIEKKVPKLRRVAPKKVEAEQVGGIPSICVSFGCAEIAKNPFYSYLKTCEEVVVLSLEFEYPGVRIQADPTGENKKKVTTHLNEKGELFYVSREYEFENAAIEILDHLHFKGSDLLVNAPSKNFQFYLDSSHNDHQENLSYIIDFLYDKLKEYDWKVYFDPSFPISQIVDGSDWYVESFDKEVKHANDWFDIDLGVLIDGERVNILPALLKFYKGIKSSKSANIEDLLNENYDIPIFTDDKKCIKIPPGRLYQIYEAFALEFESGGIDERGRLKISKWNSQAIKELELCNEATEMRWLGNEELFNFADRLKSIDTINLVEPSKNMNSTLRGYQIEGLSWLQFLRSYGLNGILADDMGLGKTIQVLAHFQIEKDAGRITNPCLVVAPTSLMFNWKNEIEKHTPNLSVLVLHGPDRKSDFDKIQSYDIVMTTYPLVARDKELLIEHQFHMLVLDEAQTIKNSRTHAYQAIQQIKANHRICLTGTPMENHLGELWSLFNFLMPGFLGQLKTFNNVYRKPIESEYDTARQETLNKRIAPFLMRRTKDVVAKELPKKTEIIQEIELDKSQSDLYEMIRLRTQAKVMREIEKKGLSRSQITVLDGLLKLRQVCCDPRLVKFEGAAKKIKESKSAKLKFLMNMLPQLIEEGRRILIFSQFTSMLSLIEAELDNLGIPYGILTGSTKDRKTPVDDFQNLKVPVLLLSLKAGGVGLNLTAADTVIHYDPWWNPAVESQATDRAHRIGQKNKVFVYKFVIKGSVEGKILSMQNRKKALTDALLDSKQARGFDFSMDDLEEVFKPLSLE